jgi:hypothetical protein
MCPTDTVGGGGGSESGKRGFDTGFVVAALLPVVRERTHTRVCARGREHTNARGRVCKREWTRITRQMRWRVPRKEGNNSRTGKHSSSKRME